MAEKRSTTFMLSDGSYNFLKKLVQVILPAFGALYFGLSAIWGFPKAEQVLGTIVCIQTFLGVCLGISTAQYEASGAAYEGHLTVVTTPETGPKVTGLHIDGVPSDLEDKKSITVKVNHEVAHLEEAEIEEEPETPEPPHKTRRRPSK